VLSTVHERAATEVFDKTACAPRHLRRRPDRQGGQTALTVDIDGRAPLALRWGELRRLARRGGNGAATLVPVRGADIGGGRGEKVTRVLRGGVVGLILDGRGRPLVVSDPNGWRSERGVEAYPR